MHATHSDSPPTGLFPIKETNNQAHTSQRKFLKLILVFLSFLNVRTSSYSISNLLQVFFQWEGPRYQKLALSSNLVDQWKNLRRHRADPSSSYSALVTHIPSKSGLNARSDPPRQTPSMGLDKRKNLLLKWRNSIFNIINWNIGKSFTLLALLSSLDNHQEQEAGAPSP